MHGKRGAVLVCVDNLPPGVSRKALKRFVQQAIDQGRGAWLADAGQALGSAVHECPAGTDAIASNLPPPDATRQPTRQLTGLQTPTAGAIRDLPLAALSAAAMARALGSPLADQRVDAPPPRGAGEPRQSGIANAVPASDQFAQLPGSQFATRARRALRLTSNIADCAILRVTDQCTGEESYRGLVAIRPARSALTVIALLDGMEVAGFRLHARRFQHRGEPCAISTTMHDGAEDDAGLTRLARSSPCALELVAATPAAARDPARAGALAARTAAISTTPAATGLAIGLAPAPMPAPMPARPVHPTTSVARPTSANSLSPKPGPTKPGPTKPGLTKPGLTKVEPLTTDLDPAADHRAFAH